MKLNLSILSIGLVASIGLTACTTTTPTNNARVTVNNNTAVVTSDNSRVTNSTGNTTTVTSSNSNTYGSNTYNSNMTRADYEKDKARYEKEVKDSSSTVGQGANDMWLWTKTKAALATTDDLRDSTINVDVVNDVTTLKGTVASAAHKTKAETVAKAIEGVKSVKNELKVSANDSMTNQMMNGNSNTKMTNTNK
jgi:hypothetical protein